MYYLYIYFAELIHIMVIQLLYLEIRIFTYMSFNVLYTNYTLLSALFGIAYCHVRISTMYIGFEIISKILILILLLLFLIVIIFTIIISKL